MLAKLATDVIKSGGTDGSTDDVLLRGVSLQREGVAVSSTVQGLDAWEGLGRLQQQAGVSAVQQEEQQDLARDAERDLIGSKQ